MLLFSAFSCIHALLTLSLAQIRSPGRPLTLLTTATAFGLLALAAALMVLGLPGATTAPLALSAGFLMLFRAAGAALLPPRRDYCGHKEAFAAIGLAGLAATGWAFVDKSQVSIAFASALVLAWPHLFDGINAFADRIFIAAARAAGARGVDSDTLRFIANSKNIVIDKSAVMSGPDLMVTNVMAFNNEPKTLLAVAASAESGSDHPVASALRQLAAQWHVGLRLPDRSKPAPGLGVIALLGGQTVVIGTTDLLKQLKIDSFTADAIARSLEADGKTVLRVAIGGRVVGVLGLEGTLRQDAGVAGMALRAERLTPWLYSGDSRKTREALAGMLGLNVLDDPAPGETALQGSATFFPEEPPLVLTLSQNRLSLELYRCTKNNTGRDETKLIAVSATEDIGAFPALKALATRRNKMASRARKILAAAALFGGIGAGFLWLPILLAPVSFLFSLLILWAFARLSLSGTIHASIRQR
ncbi:HAD family hydrolase [Roseibium denhamense]|nr:HAD family hydrolase [Roseibium denhamense]